MTWTHDDLAADLAAHLTAENRMVWIDMQLGPAGSPRPDVYTMWRSYMSPHPVAYEVKVSVADFRADVTAAKWSRYLNYAHAVIFACPVGLIRKEDLPVQCGLIVRGDTGWRMARKPTPNPCPIAQHALLKLVIDGVEREGPRARQRRRDPYASVAKALGHRVARAVQDLEQAEREVENARVRAQEIIAAAAASAERTRQQQALLAPEMWLELQQALALPQTADRWEIQAAIRAMRSQKDAADRGIAGVIRELSEIIKRYKVEGSEDV